MMFKAVHRKHSVIYSWIVSYILMILIPVITTGIVFSAAKVFIEDEITGSNELLLSKIKDNIDSDLSSIEQLSISTATNQQICNVLSLSPADQSENFTIYKAANEMSDFTIFSKHIKYYYIYLNKLKMVMQPKHLNNEELFFKEYVGTKDYNFSQWIEDMNKTYKGEYVVLPLHDEYIGDSKAIAYIRSLPIPTLDNLSANMVILLDFHHVLANGYGSERSLLIMDKNGNVITEKGIEKNFPGLDYSEMKDDFGNMTKLLDNKNVIVSYATSKINGWKYITITENTKFWGKARKIREIMLGGIILCILIGGLISYFSLKKNYNPLKQIVLFFKDKIKSNYDSDNKNNEYSLIRQVFSETLEQNQTIRSKLVQQNKALRANFIATLLKGRDTVAPLDEMMEMYDISFKYRNFAVLAIYIEDTDEDFWSSEEISNANKYYLSRFVITNVIEELTNRNCCGYMTEVDDLFVCLINLNSSGEDFKKALIEMSNEASNFIEQNYKIVLRFAAGSLHTSMEGISDSFAEAVNAMEYLKAMGLNTIVFFDEIAIKTKNDYFYPVEKEYQLINCIKASDFPAAALIVEDVFQKNLVNNTPSLEIARCLMFDLVGTILKTINQIENANKDIFLAEINPVSELMKSKTFAEMKNRMLQMIEKTCVYIKEIDGQMDYKIRDRVIDIIDRNYSDPNLGVVSIAEQIDKPMYLISRSFKEQTGEGILNYINKVRVSRAKELLREDVFNHNEIAEKVGYTNVRTFYRAFKKVEGTPPGKAK